MTLLQAWELSPAWYAGRLDAGWAPRPAEESERLLDEAGLTGEFWRLAPA